MKGEGKKAAAGNADVKQNIAETAKKGEGKKAEVSKADVKQIIADTAKVAVREALESRMEGVTNYYRAMESLLWNYKNLKVLVEDNEAYVQVEYQGKSTSFVRALPGGRTHRDMDDILEESRLQKEREYGRTKAKFDEVDKVIRLFMDRKEFIVVRMYYFNEDAAGQDRGQDAKRYTWGEIAAELDTMGILRDEKSARRWKNRIVSDMAVCMFGSAAAVGMQTGRMEAMPRGGNIDYWQKMGVEL